MDQKHTNPIDKEIAALRHNLATTRQELEALHSRMRQSEKDLELARQAIGNAHAALERLDQIQATRAPASTIPETEGLLTEPNEGGVAPT